MSDTFGAMTKIPKIKMLQPKIMPLIEALRYRVFNVVWKKKVIALWSQ